jgi:hypothetical protein
MSSKHWIERAITKPGATKATAPPAGEGRRARLAEMLMKIRKEKG